MSYLIADDKKNYLRDKIICGSRQFNNQLVNKHFLIICEDGKSYNIKFLRKDFKHLTGIDSNLNEEDFLKHSYKGTIAISNILEDQKYNWKTLKSKADRIEIINKIIYAGVQDSLFMVNLKTNTGDYPVAIRNKTINTCIGFKSNKYNARTLRKYGNSDNADEQKKIIAIFVKKPEELSYDGMVYINKLDVLLKIKPDIIKVLSGEVLKKFQDINKKEENT